VDGASVAGLFLRLLLSLAVVIGLMVGIAALLKRRGFGGFSPAARRAPAAAQVEVVARKSLGRNASIAVVRAGGKSMVLGVTEANVTMLTETDIDEFDFDFDDDEPAQRTGLPVGLAGPATPWKTMLEGLRDKTVRRT
jgi:flagellar protein FliO/FliZ